MTKSIFPLYVISHLVALFIAAFFHRPGRLPELVRGMIGGLILSLIIYALLPDAFRSSRMLPILGSILAFAGIYVCDRIIFRHGRKQDERRLILMGTEKGVIKAKKLLRQGNESLKIIGFISDTEANDPEWLGRSENIEDILRAFKITDVIFCDDAHELNKEISLLTTFGKKVNFRWFSEDAVAVIGSASKRQRGEIYTKEMHYSISDPYMRDMKRLIDVASSFFILVLSPFLFMLGENKRKAVKNLPGVLTGKNTWIGYIASDNLYKELPKLRSGVFPHTKTEKDIDRDKAHKLNFLYATEYTPLEDIGLILNRIFK